MSQLLMPSTDAMITLENVNKWYGQFHVLKNINLKVKQESASYYVGLPVRVNRQLSAVLTIWKSISKDALWWMGLNSMKTSAILSASDKKLAWSFSTLISFLI